MIHDHHKNEDHSMASPVEQSREAVEFWESRYGERDQIWSGRPNQVLVDVVSGWSPGRALDLGAGEGGDTIWLAQNGWRVDAVDISETALTRARSAAASRGLGEDQITWQAVDLTTWKASGPYDLVSAFFLHSPVEFPRADVLRRAAAAVSRNGHLLVVGHAESPPWASAHDHEEVHFPGPDEELADLGLDPSQWETVIAEVRDRDAIGPDGERAMLRDSVVLARRR
jgi:SAM-dependent methyltransferase